MAINRADLRRLILDFEAMPRELRSELRPALRRGAQPMLQAAQSNASWSSRIPPHIKLATALNLGGSGVSIYVDEQEAPHAVLYEGPAPFHHPLYGSRRHWYRQAARPFLGPAYDAHTDDVVDEIDDTVARIAATHGF